MVRPANARAENETRADETRGEKTRPSKIARAEKMTGSRLGREVLAGASLLVLDLVLGGLLGLRAWADPSRVTLGGRQDTPYTVWAFAWVERALVHGQIPWTTDHLSWPAGVNLLTNATSMGLGIVLAPVTRLWGPLVSFNVAATGAVAVTAWSAQVVLHRSGLATWPAAAFGGLVAGFGPTALAQTGGAHVHVTAAFLVPVILFGVGRVATSPGASPLRWGAALGVLIALQLTIGEEVLAIVAFAVLIGVVVGAPHVRWASLLRAGAMAAAVFGVLAAWPLWVQFTGRAHIIGGLQRGDRYADDLTAFVVPSRQVWLGSSAAAGMLRHFSSEGGAYIGVPLLILCAVVSLVHRRDPLVRTVALAGAGLAVLSLGPRLLIAGHPTSLALPWAVLSRLPLLESLLPVRFGVVIDLAAGALLAVGLGDAVRSARARKRLRSRHLVDAGPQPATLIVPALIGVACLVPLFPRLPFRTTRWDIPALFRRPSTARLADDSLIVLSPYPSEADPEVEVWLAAAGARWKSAGGTYFVPRPDGRVTIGGAVPLSAVIDSRIEQGSNAASLVPLREATIQELRRDHVDAVLAGPGPHRDEVTAWWSSVLGPPADTGNVSVWRIPGE